MKNFIILLNISIILWVTSIFTGDRPSENTITQKKNNEVESKAAHLADIRQKRDPSSEFTEVGLNPTLDLEVTEFIQEVLQSRIMDIEQGKIAQQRCTSRPLKDYGTLMVTDQTRMLEELKKLAAEKGLSTTISLGEEKSSGLRDLKEKHGKDFDDKFIKMITIDHRRDVKKFEDALSSTDPDIQVFATKYLPLVRSHLDKIRSIRKD